MCKKVYPYMCMYITTISEKEVINLKESKERYRKVFAGRNGKGRML